MAVSAVVGMCLIVFGAPVRALSGITLSPPLKDITLGPGLLEAVTDVSLTNNTSQQVRAQLKLVDLKALGEFGGTSLGQAGLPDTYDLANWMSLPGGDTVVLPANQTVKLSVRISNRADLTPGGHYGAVIVTTDSGGTVSSNVNINQQLVSLVFVKKLGGEKYGLELKTILSDQSKNRLPQVVKLDFGSTGNVHVIPRGYIEVTDPKNKLVAKGIINQDSSLILPGKTRQFATNLQPISDSNAPGQYKITVHYRYDEQQDFQTQSVYFMRNGADIWKIVSAGSAVLSVLVFGGVFWQIRKSQKKSK